MIKSPTCARPLASPISAKMPASRSAVWASELAARLPAKQIALFGKTSRHALLHAVLHPLGTVPILESLSPRREVVLQLAGLVRLSTSAMSSTSNSKSIVRLAVCRAQSSTISRSGFSSGASSRARKAATSAGTRSNDGLHSPANIPAALSR